MSAPEQTPRKSYRQGEALRDALAALNRAPLRPSVTISRDASGNYSYDVRVTDDDPYRALDHARDISDELARIYPAAPPSNGPVFDTELTRNAKGETQIKLSAKVDDPETVAAQYETLRARYPLADGTVSADKPKPAGTK